MWSRLAMDFTHCDGQLYLTVIDCGPSRLAIWRAVETRRSEVAADVVNTLFHERGPPDEVLLDNDTSFRGAAFQSAMKWWNVRMRFRCVYRPGGNGVVERMHRTVKTSRARTGCSVMEAVGLYNLWPRDDGTGEQRRPVDFVYRYAVRTRQEVRPNRTSDEVKSKFSVGDRVWCRNPGDRCDARSRPGVVTAIVSRFVVEVDGLNRNVADLRPRKSLAEIRNFLQSCRGCRLIQTRKMRTRSTRATWKKVRTTSVTTGDLLRRKQSEDTFTKDRDQGGTFDFQPDLMNS